MPRSFIRLLGTAGLLAVALVAASSAGAQNWPSRSLRIVVPGAAGSGPDIIIRAYADRLAAALGQPVVVDNRPGGSGVIAAEIAARAEPDGYTFFLPTASHLIINKYTVKNLGYDPDRDFAPVALLNRAPFFVLVHPKLPIRTLAELAAYDKANPGKLSLAYEGAAAHAASAYVNKIMGLNLLLVPYTKPTQALQDTITGEASLHVQGAAISVRVIKDGSLRALAATTDRRAALFPDIPAMGESHPEFGNYEAWVMVAAPKGTPPDIIRRLSAAIGGVGKLAEMREFFDRIGSPVAEDPSPEFAADFVRRQNEQFAKMAAAAGLKPE